MAKMEGVGSSSATVFEDDSSYAVSQYAMDIEEILQHVLRMLPAYELNRMSRVCKKWRDVSARVKRGRRAIAWYTYDSSADEDIRTQFGANFKNMSAEPQIAVLFASSTLFQNKIDTNPTNHSRRRPKAARKTLCTLTNYLEKYLPSKCEIIGCTTDGVVGTTADGGSILEMESSVSAHCFFLPQIDGVDIYTFTARTDLEDRLGTFLPSMDTPEPDRQRLSQVTNIPEDKHVKFVLLLDTEQRRLNIDADLGYALIKRYKNIVVAGGYVDHLLPDDDLEERRGYAAISNGIAFCGEGIKVASVLLRQAVNKKSDVEKHLLKLKGTHIPERRCYGFMFACIGRGAYHYRETNVESAAFRRVFPGVPLFGFFGNGEIGYDYLPDYASPGGDNQINLEGSYPDDDKPDAYVWDLPEIYHSYSTVFVLLSLP